MNTVYLDTITRTTRRTLCRWTSQAKEVNSRSCVKKSRSLYEMGILISTVNYTIRKANKHISFLSTLLNSARDRLLLSPAKSAVSANASTVRQHLDRPIFRRDRNLQVPSPLPWSSCDHNNILFSLKGEVKEDWKVCTDKSVLCGLLGSLANRM
jgi:hypothetical protein